jgi:hypothetical protein
MIFETEKALARSRKMSLEDSREESRRITTVMSRMIERLEREGTAEKGSDTSK